MLTLHTGNGRRDCAGISRREFIRVGSLGMGAAGLGLPWLLQTKAQAAGAGYVRNKSVVFLFLTGGPTQVETWDPKMTAPVEYRSMTGQVKTSLPGVSFGGTFPKTAALADRLAVVRSFQSGTGSHTGGTDRILRGGSQRDFCLGSMYARLRGATHPTTGMPSFVMMNDNDPETAYSNGKKRVVASNTSGELGPAYAAFDPSGDGPLKSNMQLRLSAERMTSRQSLLSSLDRMRREADASGAMDGVDSYRQQAYDLILGSARDAFDLSKEDPKVLQRYDTNRFLIGKKGKHPSPLGRHLLMARRLCEAGCGFITIGSPAWDMHNGGNNPGIIPGMTNVGPPLDHALSAFIEDVHERGLADDILLVVTGEMGRTPRINKKGGRDHWGNLTSLLISGGGLRMGQVVGQSAPKVDVPATTPIKTENMMATIMHTLFDPGELRLQQQLPRNLVSLVDQTQPIAELM